MAFISLNIMASDTLVYFPKYTIHESYINVGLTTMIFQPLILSNNGANLLKNRILPSVEIKLGIGIPVNTNWIVELNTCAGIVPIGYKYDFAAPEESIFQTGPYKEHYTRLDNSELTYEQPPYVSFEALIYRKLSLKNKNHITIGGGLRYNRLWYDYEFAYGATYFIDDSNPDVRLFYLYNNGSYLSESTFSLIFQANLIRPLKKNSISVGLILNYALQAFDTGIYYFSNLGFASYGEYAQTMSFIGLNASYQIHSTKKKKSEKALHPVSNLLLHPHYK